MKLLYIIIVSVILISIVAYLVPAPHEPFGVFGCSPVPFDKVLKDMYTPKELADYLDKNWNTKTSDEKNKAMADWDKVQCESQNELYNMFVEARQKRDTVDKLAK